MLILKRSIRMLLTDALNLEKLSFPNFQNYLQLEEMLFLIVHLYITILESVINIEMYTFF